MALISLRDVCWGFGSPMLLENVGFQIEKGDRVCLLGRNGVGKSTLLKIINGDLRPDSGEVWRQSGITVSMLAQEVPPGLAGNVFEVVADGLGQTGRALAEYTRICAAAPADGTAIPAGRRQQLQQMLDADDGWERLRQIENVLSRTRLEADASFADISAGLKRRTLFARALAAAPDLLLLDEPTNHLDIDAILWMEAFIQRHVPTLLFVSHDRVFASKIANRVVELDRGRLTAYACNYPTYVQRRQADLETEEKQAAAFDRKLAGEEAWIRQGVKARRTRNEGRVRALAKMREAHRARRRQMGAVHLAAQAAERSGRLVIEVEDLHFARGDAPILRGASTIIMRGDKIGIIGPNGVGKTTLLQLFLKDLPPDAGVVRHGTRLQIAYFDQLRLQLDPQATVRENIAGGNDFIVFNGQRRHVVSYLQDFLFSPERCRTPVGVLSGGEKNRLLLAKLFTQPANVLVLDEPTNDLDVETLELLEELLFEYTGTLLLVSHDRAFLNNVVTATLVFEPGAELIEYAGGYDDWLAQRPTAEQTPPLHKKRLHKIRPKTALQEKDRLRYAEKQELHALPGRIETLEREQAALYETVSDPLFYRQEKTAIAQVKKRLEEIERAIETAYARWETLETRNSR